jgi:hypothetical protein
MTTTTKRMSGLAVALAAGAALAPAAAAQHQDLRSPDARDAARPDPPAQDMRSPDARDAAEGRGIETAPRVEIVEVPVAQPAGFDAGDAALGAGAGLGLALIAAGGALYTVRMRRRPGGALG